MRTISKYLSVVAIIASLFLAGPAFGKQPKKYQVTGTVLEITDDYIAVDKGGERWEIGKDANTKITGTPKVGAKVTIEYQMSANSVVSKK